MAYVWKCELLKHIFAPSKGITFDVFNNYLKQKTMNTVTQTLSDNLLRSLALMQHLGEDYFILDGKAYQGTEDDAREQYSEQDADVDGHLPTDEKFSPSFEEWADDNLTEVDEYDTDDYNNDYLVLTDAEADDKWDEELDNYIEECIEPEIERISEGQGNLSYYIKFDEEMWKRDAKMDGRGHSLSRYDGHEHEETVNGQTFYIYRQN